MSDNNNNTTDYYSYEPISFVQSFETLRTTVQNELTNTTTTTPPPPPTPPPKLIVAAIQLETKPHQSFYSTALSAVRRVVAEHNAMLVLLQELFLGPYFCQSQDASLFALAEDVTESVFLKHLEAMANRLGVVLPVSFFERRNNAFFNSVVMIDADGSLLGVYRKSHISDGTGYQEKFYFSPGDSGFKVFKTRVGTIGVGICWDQWFPECARAMSLMGADVLLYPTAIGSEPQDCSLDSSDHWQRVMMGHAAAIMVPVIASNRYGTEILLTPSGTEKQHISFYGRSFITDETGKIVEEAKDGSDIISREIDVLT